MVRTSSDSGFPFAGGFSSAASGPMLRAIASRETVLSKPSLFILSSSPFALFSVACAAPGAPRVASLLGCMRKNRIQEGEGTNKKEQAEHAKQNQPQVKRTNGDQQHLLTCRTL